MMGGGSWDSPLHLYTCTATSLNPVLDPDQIVGMSFFSGYKLNEQVKRAEATYYYIPFA